MSIIGVLKKNKKDDNYNLTNNLYAMKPNVEDMEAKKNELIESYKEKGCKNVSFYEQKNDKNEVEAIRMKIEVDIKAEDVEERVKKQIEIVGEKGLIVNYKHTPLEIDNVTSPIISPNGVGSILKNAIKPQKLEKSIQQVNLRGTLITSKKTINDKEVEQKLLAISIPVMGKNGPYSENTINQLKEILKNLGMYSKTSTYEGKTSLKIFVRLAKNKILKEFEETLDEDRNYIEITLNVASLVKGGTQFIKKAVKVEKIKEKEEKKEEKAEEAQTEKEAPVPKKKRPKITF